MKRHLQMPARRGQRGVIAVLVGLSIAVLIGFAGLALDGGRLYVNKTEVQNAADACALAASFELTGAPNIPAGNFTIAENAGRTVATRNRVGFQGNDIVAGDVTVQFNSALNSGSWVSAAAPPAASSKYVRCTIAETGITPWFMQVAGFGDQTVSALATATLAPSRNTCTAIPIGLCPPSPGAAPNFGLVAGTWYNGGLNNAESLTGSFNWIDFSPPSGGASELSAALLGTGACTVAAGTSVGQSGAIASLRRAWNTRFGVYHPSLPSTGPTSAVPDWSGYSYTAFNWPTQFNAAANLRTVRRPAHAAYGTNVVNGNAITGLNVGPNASDVLQPVALTTRGADRRFVPVPIVNCAAFAGAQTVPVLDWACVLMLHPMTTDPAQTLYLEYVGLTTATGSPCATVGGVGNSASTGPLVPALVQ